LTLILTESQPPTSSHEYIVNSQSALRLTVNIFASLRVSSTRSLLMELFIQIAQFFLSLTLLVFLHELGHFIPAKLFKVRVSKFYVFFDFLFPLPKVLNFSLFKKKVGDTEYGLGWFPLGGYVQIDGMVDESMDVEKLKEPAQPWEFRAKPAWQRLIIMIGGVTVNIVLAMVIYAGILLYNGQEYLPMKNATNGIMVTDTLAYRLGLQDGDKILSVNGEELDDFNGFTRQLLLYDAKTIEVDRAGELTILPVPEDFVSVIIKDRGRSKSMRLIEPRFPVEVAKVSAGSPGEKAGVQAGDKIVSVNNEPTFFFDEMKAVLNKNKGQEVTLGVIRDGDSLSLPVTLTEEGLVGFLPDFNPGKFYKVVKVEYTVWTAIPGGVKLAISTLDGYVRQFKLLFSGQAKAKDSLGGFGTMVQVFEKKWDWLSFWNMTALISVILAFVNILPIPALDGGHVVFLLYEMVFRKPPPMKVMEYAQVAGMIFLLGLMLYANGLDIWRGFFQ
jgi:regulator of sigma E protease